MHNRIQQYVTKYRMLRETGADPETILHELRKAGCSKIESMLVLRELQNVSLDEAKRIVHLSQTWEDVRDDHDRFHARLERGVRHTLRDDTDGLNDDK